MRRCIAPSAGSAGVEYLGAMAAVGLMMLALVAVREHQPHRRPPVDPVARIGAIVRPPPVIRVRRTPARSGGGASRPRRRPASRTIVLAPVWAIGW